MSTHAYKEHPIGPWRMLWGWSVQSFNSLRIPPLVSSPAPWDGFSALWHLALQGSPSLLCAATSRELTLTSSGDLIGLVGGSPHSAVILCACGELAVVREGGVRHKPHGVSDGVRLQLFLFWGGRQLVMCSSHPPHLYPIRCPACLNGKGNIWGSIHTQADLLSVGMEGVKSVVKYKDLSLKSWIKEGIFNKCKIKNLQITNKIGEFIAKHKILILM